MRVFNTVLGCTYLGERCLDMFLDVRGLPKWTPCCEVRCFRRSKWFPQGFFCSTIQPASSSQSFSQPFQNLSSLLLFCYFTVNVRRRKCASAGGIKGILFFFQPGTKKKVSFWFFPLFSGRLWQDKVPVLISSIFSPALATNPQCRTSFRKE